LILGTENIGLMLLAVRSKVNRVCLRKYRFGSRLEASQTESVLVGCSSIWVVAKPAGDGVECLRVRQAIALDRGGSDTV
jgi:hypothetical protein